MPGQMVAEVVAVRVTGRVAVPVGIRAVAGQPSTLAAGTDRVVMSGGLMTLFGSAGLFSGSEIGGMPMQTLAGGEEYPVGCV